MSQPTSIYCHSEVTSLDVRRAFSSRGTAGRVVSGLLKAASKSGRIKVVQSYGRVTGSTGYEMTEEQVKSIRDEAIRRGDLTTHRPR